MAKSRTLWRCQECGATVHKWHGKCSDCGSFGTFVEERVERSVSVHVTPTTVGAVALAQAGGEDSPRLSTGIAELDRALGGGLVAGSLALLGGEPGIGKSTLLLQASSAIAQRGGSVLYVCGEESPGQVGMRARRLGVTADGIMLLPEVDVTAVEHVVRERRPDLLVVDSVQTAVDPELDSAAGSVGQVRASTARFMRIAKDLGVTTVIVGHVTKDGAIAGPRVLEHMVDAVLYFEGDRDHAYRIVRAVKNRFGSISEIGVFEMGEAGLEGVTDPSSLFLGERAEAAPGSAVMVAMEGSRPLLVEVQALVTPTYLQVPRRLATGVDTNRLLQVLAVLERRGGLAFGGHDVFVSVAGGVRVTEPAVDLPLALALASARSDVPLPGDIASFGEIGLTGQVRSVPHAASRAREATQQGFKRVVANAPSRSGAETSGLQRCTTVAEALSLIG